MLVCGPNGRYCETVLRRANVFTKDKCVAVCALYEPLREVERELTNNIKGTLNRSFGKCRIIRICVGTSVCVSLQKVEGKGSSTRLYCTTSCQVVTPIPVAHCTVPSVQPTRPVIPVQPHPQPTARTTRSQTCSVMSLCRQIERIGRKIPTDCTPG